MTEQSVHEQLARYRKVTAISGYVRARSEVQTLVATLISNLEGEALRDSPIWALLSQAAGQNPPSEATRALLAEAFRDLKSEALKQDPAEAIAEATAAVYKQLGLQPPAKPEPEPVVQELVEPADPVAPAALTDLVSFVHSQPDLLRFVRAEKHLLSLEAWQAIHEAGNCPGTLTANQATVLATLFEPPLAEKSKIRVMAEAVAPPEVKSEPVVDRGSEVTPVLSVLDRAVVELAGYWRPKICGRELGKLPYGDLVSRKAFAVKHGLTSSSPSRWTAEQQIRFVLSEGKNPAKATSFVQKRLRERKRREHSRLAGIFARELAQAPVFPQRLRQAPQQQQQQAPPAPEPEPEPEPRPTTLDVPDIISQFATQLQAAVEGGELSEAARPFRRAQQAAVLHGALVAWHGLTEEKALDVAVRIVFMQSVDDDAQEAIGSVYTTVTGRNAASVDLAEIARPVTDAVRESLGGIVHPLAGLVTTLARLFPTWLYGPAGSGKSTLAEQVSTYLGHDPSGCRISGSKHGTYDELFETTGAEATESGGTNSTKPLGVLARLIEKGRPAIMDEYSAWEGGLHTESHALLERNPLVLRSGRVVPGLSRDVPIFATDNTRGLGEGHLRGYVGTHPVNIATRDRFVFLRIPSFDQKTLRDIIISQVRERASTFNWNTPHDDV